MKKYLFAAAIVVLLAFTAYAALAAPTAAGRDIAPLPPIKEKIKEKITCVFEDNTVKADCVSPYGKCIGMKSCTIEIAAKEGTKVGWVSHCLRPNPTARTLQDGEDETISFSCSKRKKITENVLCQFNHTIVPQTCKSGKYSCTGVNNCTLSITEPINTKLRFDACRRSVAVYANGKDALASFECKKR